MFNKLKLKQKVAANLFYLNCSIVETFFDENRQCFFALTGLNSFWITVAPPTKSTFALDDTFYLNLPHS